MRNDFSQGSVRRHILAQSLPLMLAQLAQLLYNIVDRMYIGHLPGAGSLALTGLGLVFPLVTLVAAFTNLYGTGGTALFAIARGARDDRRAELLLGQTASLLVLTSVLLTVLCYVFRRPILYLFGASDASYVYADAYLRIYLLGTVFTMFTTGLNGFINAQGFPKIGMATTLIGAGLNLLLDPLFIFVFSMGVQGAALATVLSQAASALWVAAFFFGKKSLYRLRRRWLALQKRVVGEILGLGLTGFVVQGTNCLVQVVCNTTLRLWGGDLYVGVMTVANSVREILSLPMMSLSNGAGPVLGYNFGADAHERVKQGIRFTAAAGLGYTLLAWLLVLTVPRALVSMFTADNALLEAGAHALGIYFFGFFFMAFQFVGQCAFTSLRCPRRAVFFSLLRKAVIVVPLTMLLPRLGLGIDGVFWAEPISNLIGGAACFSTMYFTLYRKLGKPGKERIRP